MHYRQLLNKHILPSLGSLELRAIRPETIARWQAERLAAGHGRVSVRYALTLLGAILQRAFENGQIPSNLPEPSARLRFRDGPRSGRSHWPRSNGCGRQAHRATPP
jgi:hypothetical protein